MLAGTGAKAPVLRLHRAEAETNDAADRQEIRAADVPSVPHWNLETRTLSVNERIVKQFRVPSTNQEAVLAAFQEEGWPHRIDDPLPYRAGVKAKYRLHFTIGRLNRCKRESLIRFYGDGTGEGVCWAFSEAAVDTSVRAVEGADEKRRAA